MIKKFFEPNWRRKWTEYEVNYISPGLLGVTRSPSIVSVTYLQVSWVESTYLLQILYWNLKIHSNFLPRVSFWQILSSLCTHVKPSAVKFNSYRVNLFLNLFKLTLLDFVKITSGIFRLSHEPKFPSRRKPFLLFYETDILYERPAIYVS